VSANRVTICLPRMLAELVGEELRIDVVGDTLREALDDLLRRRPGLGLHLFDESGALRRHVLCSVSGTYTRARLDMPLRPGDTITILHSVSGGCTR
jgi:molybdopterin converting factor small subunit